MINKEPFKVSISVERYQQLKRHEMALFEIVDIMNKKLAEAEAETNVQTAPPPTDQFDRRRHYEPPVCRFGPGGYYAIDWPFNS